MVQLPDRLREILRGLDQGLGELYGERYKGLVLYGSYARGEAHEGSDVDLLLLPDGEADVAKEIRRAERVAWPLALESTLTLSTIPVSEAIYREAQGPFLGNVHREGVFAS